MDYPDQYLIAFIWSCVHLWASFFVFTCWWECLTWQATYQLTVYYIFFFRKKKKDKESKHRLEQVVNSENDEEVKTKKAYIDKRTPAQIAFDKMQEKRVSYSFQL